MVFKRYIFLAVLLLGLQNMVSAYNNTYAVIVGVADYQHDFFAKDLPYTLNEVEAVCSFLRSTKGGSVPAENICLLVDSNATKSNIILQSSMLFSKAKKNDRVIFYFSGHGSKGCFVPYDATVMGENLLYFSEVKEIFRTAKCNTKFLFADACFAGSMKNTIAQNKSFEKSLQKGIKDANKMNIAVMISCQGDESSMEMGSLQQGLFTYYLMEGLSGKANRDGNKFVTIQELYYYVYHKVQDKAASRGHKQTPELFGKFDLRLIVANI